MTWRVIELQNISPTPWRNGGGTTRELVAWPQAQTWQWRASIAQVLQDGPFSSFPGVERWFAVLEGDGVCLTVDGYMHMLTKSDQPLAFDGALDTTCELLGGATQDFNLMLQGGASARMLRVNGNFEMILDAPKIIAAYTHKMGATVQIGSDTHELLPHSLGWMHVDAHTTLHIKASDALLMEIDA